MNLSTSFREVPSSVEMIKAHVFSFVCIDRETNEKNIQRMYSFKYFFLIINNINIFGFWHINLYRLFNAKAILLEYVLFNP